MLKICLLQSICLASFLAVQPATADVYPVIIKGKVTMPDGSPPPKPVGIQRICSDLTGSAPGPITNSKGEYLWRMDVDPMRTRVCRLEATLPGYVSTAVDISGLNGYNSTAIELQTIILRDRIPDPSTINFSEADVPGKARSSWKEATKAVSAANIPEAEKHLKEVTEAAPKFGRGWHTLGIVEEAGGKQDEARAAYEHAVEADPKLLISYVALARVYIRVKDWQDAAKDCDAALKLDVKRQYPEVYLHQAVAFFQLNDLSGAEVSAKQALESMPSKQGSRAEFVLGRIYDAKGDYDTARKHVQKFLDLDPMASDAGLIQAYLQLLGKPEGKGVAPDLELP